MAHKNIPKETNAELPEHLVRFVELSKQVDTLKKQKQPDPVELERAERALKMFYLTTTPQQHGEMKELIDIGVSGTRVEDRRNMVQSKTARLLDLPGNSIEVLCKPISKLTEESLKFVVSVLGHSVKGIAKGIAAPFNKAS